MQRHSRPPNPSDHDSSAVKATEDSERDPQHVGATGASAQTSRTNNDDNPISTGGGLGGGGGGGGEPDSPRWCSGTHANISVSQRRSNFRSPRRPSSGYISDCDSQPSSPRSPTLTTADKATQTPSLTGQVMTHALQRVAQAEEQAQGGGPGTHQQHGHAVNPPSTQRGNGVVDMQAAQVGRALRLIGDDYYQLLLHRNNKEAEKRGTQRLVPCSRGQRAAGGRRLARIPLNLLPRIHQEPVALLCVSVLLLSIGWIMYLQCSRNGPDHSQV